MKRLEPDGRADRPRRVLRLRRSLLGRWSFRLGLAGLVLAATAAIAVATPTGPGNATPPTGPGKAAPARTFASVTAYLDTPRPHPRHAIVASSLSAFYRAVARAKAGQTIEVRGTVTIPGEFKGFNRIIQGGTVRVVLDRGVRFTGNAGTQLPAVWLENAGGWRIWGGTITNAEGMGILVNQMPGPVVWTGFTVTDTADQCVAVYPTEGDINRLTLKGVAGTAAPNLALDPHDEPGTGQHAWNIADATGGVVENSTFAADVLDQATGAAVSIDVGQIGPNVKVFTRARHLGFGVAGTSWTGDATYQVAGNAVQLWGSTLHGDLDIAYIEGADIQGRLLETQGVYPGADISNARVDYGRATGPILQNPRLSRVAYNAQGGIKLGDVQPTP